MSVFYMFGNPVVLLNDADLIESVLISNRDAYYKDNPVDALMPVLTESSPNINNGEQWAHKRKINPLTQEYVADWYRDQLPAMRTMFRGKFDTMVSQTASSATALQPELQRIIFDAFSVAAVGKTIGDQAYDDFIAIATQGSKRMLSAMPFGPELSASAVRSRKRFLGNFAACLEQARADKASERQDLVSLIVRHGTELPDTSIQSELGNIFYGGAFSVPSSLVTTMYCLTQNPDEEKKLIEELACLGDDFGYEDLMACRHLDHVLREGMRWRTAVPLFDRKVKKDSSTQLGGRTLPAGTHVFITSWLLHWNKGQWPEPSKYRPDRWANGVAEANLLGSGYFFPLGRGPRMCMGADFAMFTMKLYLATLYSKYRAETGKGQNYDAGQKYYFGVRMPWGVATRITPAP